MNKWLETIQFWSFPPYCALCGAPGANRRDLCPQCGDSLPVNNQACARCAAPLTAGDIRLCGQCLQHPPPYQRCIAAWLYEPPVDYAVQRLKFHNDLVFARLLGELFAEQLAQSYGAQDLPEVILPVPLHPQRLRERGFNQAAEIAKVISRRLGIPVDLTSCRRSKYTLPQADLPADERKHNVKGAFSYHPASTYRHIALLDDVMTTGHTVEELVKTIQIISQCSIDVWVCARANR